MAVGLAVIFFYSIFLYGKITYEKVEKARDGLIFSVLSPASVLVEDYDKTKYKLYLCKTFFCLPSPGFQQKLGGRQHKNN